MTPELELRAEMAELRGQTLDLQEELTTLKKTLEDLRLHNQKLLEENTILTSETEELDRENKHLREGVEEQTAFLNERLKIAKEIITLLDPQPLLGMPLYDLMTDWIRGENP